MSLAEVTRLQFEPIALDDPRWLTFVTSNPGAGPFHHPAWAQTIAECYGLRAQRARRTGCRRLGALEGYR